MDESDDRKGRMLRWVLALLWSTVFLYLLIAFNPTGSKLASLAGSWSARLGLPPGLLFKAGHVFGYVLWIFLWCGVVSGGYRRPLPRWSWVWIPLGIFLLAAIPEGLQGLNPARHPAWMDVGYNALGAVIGLGIRLVVVREHRSSS